MRKTEIEEVLERLKQLRQETEILESREKEKYNVGLLLKESIDALRICINAFWQTQMREDTRKEKVTYLKQIGLNLLDVCRVLHIGDGSPPIPSEFFIEGKRKKLPTYLKKMRKG
jgi:hypothetical protein